MIINITENALNALCGEGTSTRSDFGIGLQEVAIPEDIEKAVYGIASDLKPEIDKAYNRGGAVSRTVNGITLMADKYYSPFDGAETVCIETAEEFHGTEHDYYEFGEMRTAEMRKLTWKDLSGILSSSELKAYGMHDPCSVWQAEDGTFRIVESNNEHYTEFCLVCKDLDADGLREYFRSELIMDVETALRFAVNDYVRIDGTVKPGEYWLENYDAYGIDLAWTCELIPADADYYDFDLFPKWWEAC